MIRIPATLIDRTRRLVERHAIALTAAALTALSVTAVQAAGILPDGSTPPPISSALAIDSRLVTDGISSRVSGFGGLEPSSLISTPVASSVVTPGTAISTTGSASSPNGFIASVQYQLVASDVVSMTPGDAFESGWLYASVITSTPADATWSASPNVPTTTGVTTYTLAVRAIDTDGSTARYTQTVATLVKLAAPPVELSKVSLIPQVFVTYNPKIDAAEPVVKNGQFISNRDNWIVTPGALGGAFILSGPISGGAALLGTPTFNSCNQVPIGFSQIAQRITVPDKASVRLKFDWRMQTRDFWQTFVSNRPVDSLDVYVVDATAADPPTGDFGQTPILRDGRSPTQATLNCNDPEVTVSKSADFDITAKRGKSVWLIFQVWNRIDNNLNTFVYIDNVVVE